MKTFFCVTALSLAFTSQAVCAQSTTAVPSVLEETEAAGSTGQKVEHIRHSDAGNTIEEVRVGGETEKITVQPKIGGAAYEVKPAEGARGTAPASTSSETNGARVWNVFKF